MHNKKFRYVVAAGLSLALILGVGITSNAASEYVVKKGDTLWKIAKNYLGSGTLYGKIKEANKELIKNPNRIYVGWKLTIPDDNDVPISSVVSPVKYYDSLDAMNKAAGTLLQHPGVMGVTNERFAVISGADVIAEYSYDVAGTTYTLRCSPTSLTDISGVYVDGKLAFEDREIPDGIDYVYTNDCYLARWFRVEGQFVLSANVHKDYTKETFTAVSEEIQMVNAIQSEADGDEMIEYFDPYALVGDYADKVSQRATMNIKYNKDKNEFDVVISWGNSAFETMQWDMTARDDGNVNFLSYNNCQCKTITYPDNGKEVEKVVYKDKSGILLVNEDMTITWIDDNEEEHIFERMN